MDELYSLALNDLNDRLSRLSAENDSYAKKVRLMQQTAEDKAKLYEDLAVEVEISQVNDPRTCSALSNYLG